MDKHIVYFELLEALKPGCCAVCSLVEKAINRKLDGLLYEGISDFIVRERIVASRGYCNVHAWRLREKGDPLGHSILYKEILAADQKRLDELMAIPSSETGRKGILEFLHPSHSTVADRFSTNADCTLCELTNECEDQFLTVLPDYFDQDEAFRKTYEEYGELCEPHLRKLLLLCDSLIRVRPLIGIQKRRIDHNLQQLDEIIRKSDYRFATEPSGDEKGAWIHAVRLQVGNPGMDTSYKYKRPGN